MTEKMDLRRAKVRLLDLAHDLELADMPKEADALRCLARGPTFTERDGEAKEPEPARLNCPITRGRGFDMCHHCGDIWDKQLGMKGCTNPPTQPATRNGPRNGPNHGSFGVSPPSTGPYSHVYSGF